METGVMMCEPPSRIRVICGGVLFVLCGLLTIFGFYNARKETQRLAVRQDIVYAMLESDLYPLVIMDEVGTILQWNKGMEKLSGLTAEEAKISGIKQICPAEVFKKHDMQFLKGIKSDHLGKTTVVNCEIINQQTKRVIPVRINVRTVTIYGNRFAIARIDRVSRIVEFGDKSNATRVEADRAEK